MNPEFNKIYLGDCLATMKTWPDSFVHCVVTSPPYWGLRDYNVKGQIGLESTPQECLDKIVDVFREVRRVLRSDGTIWVNMGDSYNGGTSATRHKSAREVGRWQNERGMSDARSNAKGLKPKDLLGMPWRLALALQADGWYLRRDIIWHKTNPMPETVYDRPTTSHEYLFLLAKSRRYFYDYAAIREKASLNTHARGDGVNPKACAPASGWDKNHGGHGTIHRTPRAKQNPDFAKNTSKIVNERNKRSVWTIPSKSFPEAHFATFPEKLIEPCVLAGSPRGGVVLDPFMGAGTTALVAAKYDRKFLGCELNPEYISIAEKRVANELAQGKFL